ncbi:14246_t:CDS:2 [Rhizophagus irregularis]|nr:14246_t:CDS:2 [Rhizophagus irregularis]
MEEMNLPIDSDKRDGKRRVFGGGVKINSVSRSGPEREMDEAGWLDWSTKGEFQPIKLEEEVLLLCGLENETEQSLFLRSLDLGLWQLTKKLSTIVLITSSPSSSIYDLPERWLNAYKHLKEVSSDS